MYSKALRRHTALQVQCSAGPRQAVSSEWLERVAAQGRDENSGGKHIHDVVEVVTTLNR